MPLKRSYVYKERGTVMNTLRLCLCLLLMSRLFAGDATVEELKQRITTLEAQLAELQSKAVTFKTLAELDFSLNVFSWEDDGKLNKIPDRLVSFLGLSEKERSGLGEVIRVTRDKLSAQIAKQQPKAEKLPSGYKLFIQEFLAEGKIIEGEFLKETEVLLGPDRTRMLNRVMRSLRDRWFINFGESNITYTMTGSGSDWSCRYESKGERSSSSGTTMLSSIVRMPYLRPYLPPELVEAVNGKQAKPDDVPDF
jgi:hypothetical protein